MKKQFLTWPTIITTSGSASGPLRPTARRSGGSARTVSGSSGRPYVGGRGWIGVYLDVEQDWDDVAEIIDSAHAVVTPTVPVALTLPPAEVGTALSGNRSDLIAARSALGRKGLVDQAEGTRVRPVDSRADFLGDDLRARRQDGRIVDPSAGPARTPAPPDPRRCRPGQAPSRLRARRWDRQRCSRCSAPPGTPPSVGCSVRPRDTCWRTNRATGAGQGRRVRSASTTPGSRCPIPAGASLQATVPAGQPVTWSLAADTAAIDAGTSIDADRPGDPRRHPGRWPDHGEGGRFRWFRIVRRRVRSGCSRRPAASHRRRSPVPPAARLRGEVPAHLRGGRRWQGLGVRRRPGERSVRRNTHADGHLARDDHPVRVLHAEHQRPGGHGGRVGDQQFRRNGRRRPRHDRQRRGHQAACQEHVQSDAGAARCRPRSARPRAFDRWRSRPTPSGRPSPRRPMSADCANPAPGAPEFFVSANGTEHVDKYVGKPAVRNAKAASPTVVASEPPPPKPKKGAPAPPAVCRRRCRSPPNRRRPAHR